MVTNMIVLLKSMCNYCVSITNTAHPSNPSISIHLCLLQTCCLGSVIFTQVFDTHHLFFSVSQYLLANVETLEVGMTSVDEAKSV